MTVAIDRPRSGDSGTRAAARRAEAAAAALGRADPAQVVRLAHSAAMLAHLAAGALESYGAVASPASLLAAGDHPTVPFPPSWRRRIEKLAEHCLDAQSSGANHD